jgi:hypothetical protein
MNLALFPIRKAFGHDHVQHPIDENSVLVYSRPVGRWPGFKLGRRECFGSVHTK